MVKVSAAAEKVGGTKEVFKDLLEEFSNSNSSLSLGVRSGVITAVEEKFVVISVSGLKAEGRVALEEFGAATPGNELKVGDTVSIFVERLEDREGNPVLSRKRARQEESWEQLEKSFLAREHVSGIIFGKVKGGFTVDLTGVIAFLPSSQADIRPVRDLGPIMGKAQPFIILKMDKKRGNVVVSRRAVMEDGQGNQGGIVEGAILEGSVKNITDYGAFVDLGGVDGLLHVTDIAWKRVNHPSEVLKIGQPVKVQVIRISPENGRISLGIKQLSSDPWDGIAARYPLNNRINGKITNIADYGAFVELEPGVEGLIHVSEMSWTKKNFHPNKVVTSGQEVEVLVLDVDQTKRRISLGLKQCVPNPWTQFSETYGVGDTITGEIKNITEFGLFIGLPGDIDGMIHLNDLDWINAGEVAIKNYAVGQSVTARIIDIDMDKERIALGIKQLTEDPVADKVKDLKKGDIVTCVVSGIHAGGIDVTLADGLTGFIKKAELSRDRGEQRGDRFAVGEKVDATIISIDRANRKIALSIKAGEIMAEKEAMAKYGSSDSGARLGDILGKAMNKGDTSGEDKS